MEIVKFEPDSKEIERRKDIKPFGDTSKIRVIKSTTAPRFNLYTTEIDVEYREEEQKQCAPYRPSLEEPTASNAYVPPTIKRPETCSVKLSNLPLDMTRDRLYSIIKEHTNVFFMSPNLVMNRETGLFRGFAFVTLESKDDAMKFIKDLRGIAIDSLGLSVEIAR
ncbi:RRM motif-containing protein [Encephalitozoon intestinalis ATCC 50506]|uniref:RRM motif-containing protein n=1 Tax=Encephalitozoon intestinalis (strain ATCC 50506) TaxID=876142 RepID=E0S5F1_ENCIT|nr:RRM motif-containing protein [Encephalitozoon intestinalis ATCC 50506]ADM10936.1 RRM motif-containing protein [Encephalitozoon intestinalis ATCC 50506]UTX44571.1 RRM motif-containing protein [Encephalitozoon intestinalis]